MNHPPRGQRLGLFDRGAMHSYQLVPLLLMSCLSMTGIQVSMPTLVCNSWSHLDCKIPMPSSRVLSPFGPVETRPLDATLSVNRSHAGLWYLDPQTWSG